MILRGIDFGPVLDASGVRGFFGEGYWYHKYLQRLGLDFTGSAFVAKTTTLEKCLGNMQLDASFKPKQKIPNCIVVKPLRGAVLNAVGLSGPGAVGLFEKGIWQTLRQPFFLSFASVAETISARKEELYEFLLMLEIYSYKFIAPFGLQINFSCPNINTNYNNEEMVDEMQEMLSLARSFLKIPLVPKINILLSPKALKKIDSWEYCDAICVSNTLPWGALPEKVNWQNIFGSNISPLAKYGGGGLSGAPLFPLVLDWVINARAAGIKKSINAGGGILRVNDVKMLCLAGANSIFIGSVAFLRPWSVQAIIREAHRVFT